MNAKHSTQELKKHLIDVCAHLVRSIVKEPDLVEIKFVDRKDQLTILVSPKDRGLVIGRGGQNLAAIESSLLLALSYLSAGKEAKPRFTDLPSLEVRAIDEA